MAYNGEKARAWMPGMILLAAISGPGLGEGLKDPALRDEDISATHIQVDYWQEGTGLWIYEYSITAPDKNKGTVSDFAINLECGQDFDNAELVPDPVSDSNLGGEPANPDPVTPVAIRADHGSAYDYNLGDENNAYWLLNLPPGHSAGKLRLISNAEPGLRKYEVKPYLDTEGYDYSQPVPSLVPWTEDFTFSGVVAAPGCPGEVPPVEEPTFAGNQPGNESEEMNQLLTYKKPLKNRLHLDEGERHARVTIVYGDELDPETFKVEPGWAKRYFSPEPGTEETVEVPMKEERLRLFLEGRRTKAEEAPEGKKDAPPEHARKDRDEFEFRLPESKPGERKGQGNDDQGRKARLIQALGIAADLSLLRIPSNRRWNC